MKKIGVLFLLVVSIFAVFAVSASASDIVGKSVYTDIVASINDYNIASYNIDGYTSVVAEDLRNYGFNVVWNAEARTLHITRGSGNTVASTYIAPYVSKSDVGKNANDIYRTDIKTYINGSLVESYNIGGKTIVRFDDLSVYGAVSYNDSIRRLDLDISDGLNYKISAPIASSRFEPEGLYFKTNSAGGIQVRWNAINNTNKTINYYTTKYYMFNSVGDFAYDRYGDNSFTIKTVGPVAQGGRILDFTSKYEGETYDAPCSVIYLYEIFLEYSDGTSETIYYKHNGREYNGEYVL